MSESVEFYEKKIKEYTEKMKAAKAKESAKDRKRRDHAMMVLGGLVEAHFDGWTEIGFGMFADFLSRHESELSACKVEKLNSKEADERLREWSKKERAMKKAMQGGTVRSQFADAAITEDATGV